MKISDHVIYGNKSELKPISIPILDISIGTLIKFIFSYDHRLNKDLLIISLRKIIDIYPYIAGHIEDFETNYPKLFASNKGVLFSTTSFKIDLPRHLSPKLIEDRFNVALPFDWSYKFDECDYLLQIKLYKFNNGSVLDISLPHFLCDGNGLMEFVSTWASVARGGKYLEPQFNRSTNLKCEQMRIDEYLKKTPTIIKENFSKKYDSLTITRFFHLNADFLDKLVSDTLNSSPGIKSLCVSQVWVAYIWKLIMRCSNEGKYNIASFVGLYNARVEIGLRHNFFGIATSTFYLDKTKQQVNGMSIADAAIEIQNTLHMAIKRQAFSSMASGARLEHTGILSNYVTKTYSDLRRGGLLFNNMSALPMYKANFGSGEPVWMDVPTSPNTERIVYAFPTFKKNGGIIIRVQLPVYEMDIFQDRFYAE